MRKLIGIALLVTIAVLSGSCTSQTKFEKDKWLYRDDVLSYPYRKLMIDDLIKNYQLKGMSFREIVKLLGQPLSSPDSVFNIWYEVDIRWGTIDPVYGKSLILHLNKNSIVENFEVDEYNH